MTHLLNRRRVGANNHAFGHRHGAGGDRFGRPLHLDQTHAAIAGDGEAFMEAEMGNFNPELLASLQDGQSRFHLDLLAIDGELRHGPSP